MNLNIRVLIVDENRENADELARALMPHLTFIGHDTVCSIQEALDAHIASPYDICFVSSRFQGEKIAGFLRDIKKLYSQTLERLCIFIQFHPALAPDYDCKPMEAIGFNTVISKELEKPDIKKLKEALKEIIEFNLISEKISDIDSTTKLILQEIDRVSNDRKRGVGTKFNTIALDFAANLVEFDPRIMEKYFEKLVDQSADAKAPRVTRVRIPAKVLKRNLPKLLEDKYQGASSRVWKKLLNKYGISEGDQSVQPDTDQSSEGSEKAPEEEIIKES